MAPIFIRKKIFSYSAHLTDFKEVTNMKLTELIEMISSTNLGNLGNLEVEEVNFDCFGDIHSEITISLRKENITTESLNEN